MGAFAAAVTEVGVLEPQETPLLSETGGSRPSLLPLRGRFVPLGPALVGPVGHPVGRASMRCVVLCLVRHWRKKLGRDISGLAGARMGDRRPAAGMFPQHFQDIAAADTPNHRV